MATTAYLAGASALVAAVTAVTFGAVRLRTRLLPDWRGAPARLAEIVIALALPFAVAQGLGTFGWFSPVPVLAGCLVVSAALVLAGRRPPDARPIPADGAGPEPGVAASRAARAGRQEEIVAAIAATAVVGAQWLMHTADALGRGMTHGDTLWYHAPFAARFVQSGHLTYASETGLEGLATPLHWYLPLNGSLAHALLMLPFDRDVLSPVLNVGFFALGVLAGWCIGARRGAGALGVLGTVVILGLPTLTGTQPGQASNDVMTAALYLTAIALLLEAPLRPVPTAVAAVAAGLGLGVKLTVLAPLAVVTFGVVVLALRARRPITAVAWCGALFLSGGYWLVRNWVVAGNPVPWSEASLGPIGFDRAIESRPALVTLLDRADTWDRFVLPGLRDALGWGWIVVLAIAIGGAVVGIVRGGAFERVAGAASLVGIMALPFIPFSADFGGGIFVFIVRYLVPELVVGVMLMVLTVAGAAVWWRRGLGAVLVVLVVSNVTSEYIEGAQLWPDGYAAVGIVTAVIVVVAGLTLWRAGTFGAEAARRTVPRVGSRRVLAGAAGAVVALGLVLAYLPAQRAYLRQRYVDAGVPNDAVNAAFRDVHRADVAAIARDHFYPLFGLDLSNRVQLLEGPDTGSARERCRTWRELVEGFDYVVLGADPFSAVPPDPAWIADDPSVRVELVDGDVTVYRVGGPLDPSRCP